MLNFKTVSVGLALALSFAGAASPALAKQRAAHPGYDAQARAVGDIGDASITTGPRAAALRACNEQADRLVEYSWGNESSDRYRACMSERGQME